MTELNDIGARLRITRERNQLQWNEEKIMTSLREMGLRLAEIKQQKLWQHDYESFDDYCAKKWGFGPSRARQILSANDKRLALADMAKDEPEAIVRAVEELTESQVRNLTRENPEPAKQLEVIKKAVAALPVESEKKPKLGPLTKQAKAKTLHTCPLCSHSF